MNLSPAEKIELIRLVDLSARLKRENKLNYYQPYAKQQDFHAAGKGNRERLLMAGNRCGKTECGAAEMAYHLTGLYPDWWEGRVFDYPIKAWAASVTSEMTREGVQQKLIGPPAIKERQGTGYIPKSTIGRVTMRQGIPDAIDTVLVRHVSGHDSVISFKSYDQGREKFQATDMDIVWFDEEPPISIYTEGYTRTHDRKGIVYLTFTPLLGMSEVVRSFLMRER